MDRRTAEPAEERPLPQLLIRKAEGIWRSDKRTGIIVACGILGIALILLSGLSGGRKSENRTDPSDPFPWESYTEGLESRLAQLIGSIEGAGETRVMVSLAGSPETVYAAESSRSDERALDQGEGALASSQTLQQTESIVLVDRSDGREPLIQKQLGPEVGGVAVVCAGGGDAGVRQRVIETVTTVLGITSARVYVTQLASP